MARAALVASRRCACRCSPTAWAAAACPADHELAFARTRGAAEDRGRRRRGRSARRSTSASSFGSFGDAQVVHVVDTPASGPRHVATAASPAGDLTTILDGDAAMGGGDAPTTSRGSPGCATPRRPRRRPSEPLLEADGDPIKPTRVYGELRKRRLDRDAVVVCDGGDFVSYAGQVRRRRTSRAAGSTRARTAASAPGWATRWRPRVAHPDRQVVRDARRRRRRVLAAWTSTRSCATTCRS